MRRAGLVLALLLAGCAGDAGPAGPAGPQGPAGATGAAGPAGSSVSFYSYSAPITSATMSTPAIATAGVVPGMICYIGDNTLGNGSGPWHTFDVYPSAPQCYLVGQGNGSQVARASLPPSMLNGGLWVRIILFWPT